MNRIDSPDGLFHEGDPASGQKGTKVTATYLNDNQEVVVGVGGNIVTSAVEVTLTESDGVLYAAPPEGLTVPYHLPAYVAVGPLKRYLVKNIGQGIATLDAADGKTVDGGASINLNPGDRTLVLKDGANWQTF